MNTQGPYFVSPNGGVGNASVQSIDIPIVIGGNGYIEVINTSNYEILVSFQSLGQVYQEARSKVLYKAVNVQGTQMVTIAAVLPGVINGEYIRLPVSYQNGETGHLGIYLNIYQEGEIDPYSPVSLADAPSQSSYFASKKVPGAAFTLVLPTSNFYESVPPSLGVCNLLGFDLTVDTASTSVSNVLTITGLNNMPDGSTTLQYQIRAPTGSVQAPPLIVRYPTPIPNFLGSNITFNVPALNNATIALNAYYSLS